MSPILVEPDISLLPEIIDLFTDSITNTFEQNGIKDLKELEYEISEKSDRVKNYINSKNDNEFFIVAESDNAIAGIAGIYPVSDTIIKNYPTLSKKDIEIGSVYIKPEFQRQGITRILLKRLVNELLKKKFDRFYLDCGYPTSQVYWTKMFGDPIKTFSNYFGKDESYMIWEIDTEKALRKVDRKKE
jgi:GNAT superfamily N-acetyltransferase